MKKNEDEEVEEIKERLELAVLDCEMAEEKAEMLQVGDFFFLVVTLRP